MQETSGATILANVLPGLGIDEFLTRTDLVAGTTSNFLADALGSPLAVTDNAGVVQTEYIYEAFGGTTATGAPNTSSFQYTGRENDGTALYFYRGRYYSPVLQRFLTEDPLRIVQSRIDPNAYVGDYTLRDVPGLLSPLLRAILNDEVLAQKSRTNLFEYVNSNPINFSDPEGEAPRPILPGYWQYVRFFAPRLFCTLLKFRVEKAEEDNDACRRMKVPEIWKIDPDAYTLLKWCRELGYVK